MPNSSEENPSNGQKKGAGWGGHRPGAGRPKNSGKGRGKSYTCYLDASDSENFEWFAEIVDMSPQQLLKAFARATIAEGLKKIGEAVDNQESEMSFRLMFRVGVDFNIELEPGDDELESDMTEEDYNNAVFLPSAKMMQEEARRAATTSRSGHVKNHARKPGHEKKS